MTTLITQKTSTPMAVGLLGLLAAIAMWGPSADAQSLSGATPDLTERGWTRDTQLLSLKIDQYKSATGSISLALIAFPATDQSAGQWLDEFVPVMMAPDYDAGRKVHLLNNDEMGSDDAKGPMAEASASADIATRTVMVLRKGDSNNKSLMTARAIIRENQPVQLSLLTLGRAKATALEHEQAKKIRFNANLPVNESAAFLGLNSMISVMTEPLIYPPQTTSPPKKPARVAAAKPATVTTTATTSQKRRGKGAPHFKALPGPQVQLTGKMLGSLPAGYRLQVKTTNYWTNKAMTATRSIYLTLTGDGQFEWANFSISGGTGGVTGSIHTSDKKGSVGTVYGSTNPAGSGTQSVALNKRDGLDPSKYGTYYISGNEIQFRYANGSQETRSFKTDGYKTLILNGKKFFVSTPDGWERRNGDKDVRYRSLDGAYLARVSNQKGRVNDGREALNKFLGRLRENGLLGRAGEIVTSKGKGGYYGIARVSVEMRDRKGGPVISQTVYLKNGRSNYRLVRVFHYGKTYDESAITNFLHYLN